MEHPIILTGILRCDYSLMRNDSFSCQAAWNLILPRLNFPKPHRRGDPKLSAGNHIDPTFRVINP